MSTTERNAVRGERPAVRRTWGRKLGRALLWLVGVVVLLLVVAGFWLRSQLKASLPRLDGQVAVAGLSTAVTIERDDLGVPTIHAANRVDAARAMGFLHGQDRFFQMDLLRRKGAGELSELFGGLALELDQSIRVHRFRDVARRVIAASPPDERALVNAYTDGVNAGLGALGAKPFEYIALRGTPQPWQAEDTVLAVLAMFLELNGESIENEKDLGRLAAVVPPAVFDFVSPHGTEWDAPLIGEPMATGAIPGPEIFDLRAATRAATPAKAATRSPARDERLAFLGRIGLGPIGDPDLRVGSNNWAVAGSHTADGKAWLANDMHLGISVPNTWYRASIVWPDGQGGSHRITGVTLPGVPRIVVGSNGHVAWGFTNSYGDYADLIDLETDPAKPGVYRTPEGWKAFEDKDETIHVHGAPDVPFKVQETIWGPVVDHDGDRPTRALAWTAHHPEGVNLRGTALDTAATLEEALALAHESGIPPQNFVVADANGRVAWTIIGQVPRRVGFDGRLPTSWADGTRRWDGWLRPEEVPAVIDPPVGRLWTANARTVDGEALARLGDGGFDLGARARQIRDGLLALDKATPRDLLAIQLDDRALWMDGWRKLLLGVLTPEAVAGKPERAELKRLLETTWTGHASIDSAAYRIVRVFRGQLTLQVFAALSGQLEVPERDRFNAMAQFEGPLWKLLQERPMNFLAPKFASWDEQLLAAVDATVTTLQRFGPKLADRTWGERNTTLIQHPLAQALPFLHSYLDPPSHPLPGDMGMPRVQGPGFGASERMVVSPGQEAQSFFHMPVGQSGHPMSPYYRKGHEAWEKGEATPFLPGAKAHELKLVPPGAGAP